ncbi:MAG: hypothetical protein MUF64_22360 [Polyangiaceae bacterium]|jgi:hypothetical protein|nr:hypothetical protein [Polyangiaceae bacterium]
MILRSLPSLLLLLTLLFPRGAAAQESDADRLFREGREATRRGDHQLACQKFSESYRLDAAAGTLINLGMCEEKLGRVSLAWRHLTDALKQLPGSDDRVPVAKRTLESLEKRIARLTVVLPPGEEVVRVLLNGSELPAAERTAPLVLDPGEHVLLATTVDGREARQSVKLSPGGKADLKMNFPPASSRTTPRAAPREDGSGAPRLNAIEAGGSGTRKAVGWGLLLGGVVIGAGGGIYGFKNFYDLREEADLICPPPGCKPENVAGINASEIKRNDAEKMSTVGFVSAGVGITLAGIGTYLLLSERQPSGRPTSRTQLFPSVSHQGAGFLLQGAW